LSEICILHMYAIVCMYVDKLCVCIYAPLCTFRSRDARMCEKSICSDCVLSKTPFFLYLERGNAQDLQTIRRVVGCSKSPTSRRAPKGHHVESTKGTPSQERRCARSSGTNVLVSEHTRDQFTLPSIAPQMHENEFE